MNDSTTWPTVAPFINLMDMDALLGMVPTFWR